MYMYKIVYVLLLFLFNIKSLKVFDDNGNRINGEKLQALENLFFNSISSTQSMTKTIYTSPPKPTHVIRKEPTEDNEIVTITAKPGSTNKTNHSNNTQHKGEHDEHERKESKESKEEQIENIREKDPIGASTMFVVGLITTSLNFVSCGYLLYLVNKLRKKVGFHSSLRILTYSVLNDILVGGFFTFSIVYSTLFDSLISGNSCQFIGFIINTIEATDMLLIGFIALSTCLKAVKGTDLPTGKFDFILLSFIIGLPLISTSILAQFHAFGPEEFWCLIDDDTLAGKISTISLLSLYCIIAILIITTYIIVKKHNNNNKNNNIEQNSRNTILSMNSDTLNHSSLAKKFYNQVHRKSVITLDYAEVKLETHLKIHFFQYTPPTFHLICMLFGYKTSWVFTLAILSTNLSGVFQLMAYLHHQKKKKKQFNLIHQNTIAAHKSPEKRKGLENQFELKELSTLSPNDNTTNKLRNSSHHEPSPIQGSNSSISFALPSLKYPTISSSDQTLLSTISPPNHQHNLNVPRKH